MSSTFLVLVAVPCLAQESGTGAWREYRVAIQARGHNISGLCMMDSIPSDGIVGTIVNEFGVKAFDFAVAGGRTTVFNVIAPLNKWYIRKVLRKDVGMAVPFLELAADTVVCRSKRTLKCSPDGSLELVNRRYDISYSFTPMIEQP